MLQVFLEIWEFKANEKALGSLAEVDLVLQKNPELERTTTTATNQETS